MKEKILRWLIDLVINPESSGDLHFTYTTDDTKYKVTLECFPTNYIDRDDSDYTDEELDIIDKDYFEIDVSIENFDWGWVVMMDDLILAIHNKDVVNVLQCIIDKAEFIYDLAHTFQE